MDVVKALGAPYGLERSCKFVAGALLEDRFLVSLHRTAFGADAGVGIRQVARALDAPDALMEAIAEAQAEADIVHLGYEGGVHATYKLYLEYAVRVRRAQVEKADAPVLVHLAFKWVPEARKHEITRYTWLPARGRAEIAARVHALLAPANASRALACVLALLSVACARTKAENLFLMEVEEPGNPRHSCDLNLYQADLQVRDIVDVVRALGMEFAIPHEAVTALLSRCGALALGHIAGGRGRDGGEFVTVYYGVEGHG
jgi:tryptophan 7-halogenase